MNLNVEKWKPFPVSSVLTIYNGKGITKEEIENNPGVFPAIQSGEDNNGCIGYIDKEYCISMGYTYTDEACLTVARSGSAGFVAYQPFGCVVGDSAKLMIIKADEGRNVFVYLFLKTLLTANRYKYTYGRKVTEEKYSDEILMLPVDEHDLPDWEFIKKYIQSLKCNPITTSVSNSPKITLDTSDWKEFFLHKLFYTKMGNGIDAVLTTNEAPKYNYVSRDSGGNGVVGFVDIIEGEEPFPAGAMSLALGGSFLGSCFIQTEPFYTAQNVAVLQEKVPLSNYTKLFIATLIRNECKVKYQAFGRELNAHYRKDFTLKLPIKKNKSRPVIDETHEFSDNGYIPDWEWMKAYIKSLPYSDRIGNYNKKS